MCMSTVIESTSSSPNVVLRLDERNDLNLLQMEPLDVTGRRVPHTMECVQLRSMVVVHDPMVDFVAA